MTMKQWISPIIVASALSFFSWHAVADEGGTLYQAGTLIGIMNNAYDGSTTFAQLLKHGDLGLGTDQGVSGELVIDGSSVYLASPHGDSKVISPETKTPFAMIVNFKPTQTFELHNIKSMSAFCNALDKHIGSKNYFYAMKVTGDFTILGRAFDPAKQGVSLAEWMKGHQHLYRIKNIAGTLVIFRSPQYAGSLAVAGYHVHFLSSDKKRVFHLYDVSFKNATVQVEKLTKYDLILPSTHDFAAAQLRPISDHVVKKMETR